jgi:hypothetical protein
MKNVRFTLYGTIHQKAKKLGLSDDSYRGFLFALTSKTSCKDLSMEQLESVDDIFNDKIEERYGKTSYILPEGTPNLYKQEHVTDKMVYGMLVSPKNGWVWYIFECDKLEQRCFGLVDGDFAEIGYFWLPELEQNGVLQVNMQPTAFSALTGDKLKRAA